MPPIVPSVDDALAWTPRETAARLQISERTLWSLTKRGDIPHIRLGRSVRYPSRLLEEWIAQQATPKK